MSVKTLAKAAPFLLFLAPSQTSAPHFDRILALRPSEGVFAYSRISPDGRNLAYASETGSARIVTVIDLSTKKPIFAERGIDAYFAPDGRRLMFLSQADTTSVSIYHLANGFLSRRVSPVPFGGY